MGVEDATVNIDMDVRLGDLAVSLSRQVLDDEVIEFVKLLDEKMASWDFTVKLGEYFAKKTREFHTELPGTDGQKEALSRVTEFARQLALTKTNKFHEDFYTIHTDPAAEPASLNIFDLATVRDLATTALVKLDADG